MSATIIEQSTGFKPYLAYKPSDVEWLGEIPAHWEVRRLRSTVVSYQNGVWGTEPNGSNEIACVRVADFDRVRFRAGIAKPTLRSVDPDVIGTRKLLPGDLLLEVSGGGEKQPVGAVVLYDHKQPAVCSNFIARLRPLEGFESRFLTYLHWALYSARVNVRSIKQSIGIQNLDKASYLNEAAGFPPLAEQRAIATFLDRETAKIDTLVAKKERLIELLQEKRTALISHAVTKGLVLNVPMKDSGVEWLGEIPAHWQVMRLARITACLDGQRVPLNAEQRSYMQGIYPYWGANSIVDYVDRWLFDEELVLIGEDGAPFFDSNREVAFTVSGKLWVNNHAHVLRPKPQVQATFLSSVLNCVDYAAFIDGATRDKLTQGDMNGIPVQVPPLSEQYAIASYLGRETAKLDALIRRVRKAIKLLEELRSTLISAAITGTIDVREEAAVSP